MADADTTDFDVDAEAPGGGVREDTATDADEADDQEERLVAEGEIAGDSWKSYWTCWTSMATSTSMSKAIVRW